MLLFLSSNIPAAPAYGVYAVMEEPVPSSLSGLYSARESAHYYRLLSQGRGIKDQTADNAKKVRYVARISFHSLQYGSFQNHF